MIKNVKRKENRQKMVIKIDLYTIYDFNFE